MIINGYTGRISPPEFPCRSYGTPGDRLSSRSPFYLNIVLQFLHCHCLLVMNLDTMSIQIPTMINGIPIIASMNVAESSIPTTIIDHPVYQQFSFNPLVALLPQFVHSFCMVLFHYGF